MVRLAGWSCTNENRGGIQHVDMGDHNGWWAHVYRILTGRCDR